MIRKALALIVLAPLAVLIVALLLANRQQITISYDPFGADPVLALSVPLYLVALLLMTAGVIIGGVAAWLGQRKWRGAARRARAEAAALRGEVDGLRRRMEVAERAALPSPGTGRLPAGTTLPERRSSAA